MFGPMLNLTVNGRFTIVVCGRPCLCLAPGRGSSSVTRPDIDTRHRAAAEVAQKGSGEVVWRAQYAARRLVLLKVDLPKGTGGLTGHHHASPSHDRAAHTGGWRRPLLRSVRLRLKFTCRKCRVHERRGRSAQCNVR
eukprot:scaffold60588_cov63-Phaeocystis_antarctica.AAC.1